MANSVLRHLWSVLNFKLGEILQIDFCLGIIGGVGAVVLALQEPEAALRGVSISAGLVGVIIGAVLAGLSVQVAFMDQAFLRKIRAIGRNPTYYLAPLFFTATIGIFAMLAILILSILSAKSPVALLAPVCGVTGFLTIWTTVSLLHCMATLVQFVGLKVDALDVPDDVDDHCQMA